MPGFFAAHEKHDLRCDTIFFNPPRANFIISHAPWCNILSPIFLLPQHGINMTPRLRIESFVLGEWATNCYVVHVEKGKRPITPCWIIDAGFHPEPLIEYIKLHDMKPEQVILTHGHVDHIAGLYAIRGAFRDIPILIHSEETEFLTEPMLNLSIVLEDPITAPPATGLLAHGQKLALEEFTFEVRHTPGHSPGSVSLIQAENRVAIVGDTLFAGSVGRHDFPTSNGPQLFKSIESQLMSLPDDTDVLPGHGPSTTIGHERLTNPYLRRTANTR